MEFSNNNQPFYKFVYDRAFHLIVQNRVTSLQNFTSFYNKSPIPDLHKQTLVEKYFYPEYFHSKAFLVRASSGFHCHISET